MEKSVKIHVEKRPMNPSHTSIVDINVPFVSGYFKNSGIDRKSMKFFSTQFPSYFYLLSHISSKKVNIIFDKSSIAQFLKTSENFLISQSF